MCVCVLVLPSATSKMTQIFFYGTFAADANLKTVQIPLHNKRIKRRLLFSHLRGVIYGKCVCQCAREEPAIEIRLHTYSYIHIIFLLLKFDITGNYPDNTYVLRYSSCVLLRACAIATIKTLAETPLK